MILEYIVLEKIFYLYQRYKSVVINDGQMKFTLLLSGKTNKNHLSEGIQIYKKRIERYVPFGIEIAPEIKKKGNLTEQEIKNREGKELLKKIPSDALLFLLDERGKEYTSLEFSNFLNIQLTQARKDIIFAIGGPYGFSDEIIKRSNLKLSLSKMTFSHQIIRLIFLEQLYRAFTILKGEPYHHG